MGIKVAVVHHFQKKKTGNFKEVGQYAPTSKHAPGGHGSLNPIPDKLTGQHVLDTSYISSNTKQRYNIYEGKLVKFQPDGQGGWHSYQVTNTAKEVPGDVLRQMKSDGLITNAQYKKFLQNK